MASVWFTVVVFISAQRVFARDCSDLGRLKSCDECIRCGGDWCTDPGIDEPRCSRDSDAWCLSRRAVVPVVEPGKEPGVGSSINPRLVTRTIRIGELSDHQTFDFPHSSSDKPQVEVSILNSTVRGLTAESFKTKMILTGCQKEHCIAELKSKPSTEFCPINGAEEFVTVKFQMDEEQALLKYHIPCACDCSKSVEKHSEKCNNHGDHSCGVCSCHTGWKGDNCETKEECDRGDIFGGCIPLTSSLVCWDNGRCLCGGKCECFSNKPGSQYFDEYCTDICTSSSYCDACIRNPTPGRCKDCQTMIVENFDRTLMSQKDELNRTVWIECTEPTDACQIKYAAMKDKLGDTHVMIMDLCQPVIPSAAVAGGIDITIPVILGVIALVAMAAAAAGFTMYKKSSPPLPLSDPQYQNIGAEDCTGENPLYKPPTSSYKNPTYGKW